MTDHVKKICDIVKVQFSEDLNKSYLKYRQEMYSIFDSINHTSTNKDSNPTTIHIIENPTDLTTINLNIIDIFANGQTKTGYFVSLRSVKQ